METIIFSVFIIRLAHNMNKKFLIGNLALRLQLMVIRLSVNPPKIHKINRLFGVILAFCWQAGILEICGEFVFLEKWKKYPKKRKSSGCFTCFTGVVKQHWDWSIPPTLMYAAACSPKLFSEANRPAPESLQFIFYGEMWAGRANGSLPPWQQNPFRLLYVKPINELFSGRCISPFACRLSTRKKEGINLCTFFSWCTAWFVAHWQPLDIFPMSP